MGAVIIPLGGSFSWGVGVGGGASEIILIYCDASYEISTLREALISEVSVAHYTSYQKRKTR